MRFILLILLLSGLYGMDAHCQPMAGSLTIPKAADTLPVDSIRSDHWRNERLLHAQLRETSLQRNITLGSAILLFLLILLACRGYRIKQRTLRKVEAQQLVIRRQNQQLQQWLGEKDKLLTEKDLLMREIHHRVKDNLNIIISLLESQSRYLNNPAAQAALRDTQNRVHAVFLLHQKLYGATAGMGVDAFLYVTELISHLSETLETKNNGIIITQKVDPVSLSIDTAEMLPLAIIINEAVTNAVKHAFPAGRKGHIHLLLNKDASGAVCLQVRDNGVGSPFHFQPDDDQSRGLSLINGLVAQMHGSWTIENDGCVIVTVQFPRHRSIKHSGQETSFPTATLPGAGHRGHTLSEDNIW